MNNKLKLLAFPAILLSLFMFSNSALASEVTGDLTTGIHGNNGNVVEGIVIASPTANPVAGTYALAQNVALSVAGASSIRYTLDNSTPSCASGQVYSQPIEIASSKTLKAISCYATGQSSSVGNYAYTIRIAVNADQVNELLNEDTLALPAGATYNSTPSLQAEQSISINAGANTVTLPVNTIITTVSGQNFDATAIIASTPASGTLSGLTEGAVMDGSLQWGIVNLGLQFSNPITISINVGNSFNGQTLNIVRSTSGNSGWTADGIVSPATCVVSGGLCTFGATKASYYAVYHTPAPARGGGGGGGGGHSTPVYTAPVVVAPIVTAPVVTTPIITAPVQEVLGVKINKVDELIKTLKFGNKNEKVRELQTELQKQGFFPKNIKPTNYFGQITATAIKKYQSSKTSAVLGVKNYANGALLRGRDKKIYVLKNGQKQHIKSLAELAKYRGQKIYDVSDAVINGY